MSNLFSELQKSKEAQHQAVLEATSPAKNAEKPEKVILAQQVAQKLEQVSKGLSKPLSKFISADVVEELAFSLRKTPQSKINATIPLAWKDKLDDLAFRLKVGKYELLTYMVGVCLGEVKNPQD